MSPLARQGGTRRLSLRALRLILVAYVAVLVVMGNTLLFLSGPAHASSALVFTLVVCGTGLYGFAGLRWSQSRPLATSSPDALAASYRVSFFIGIGMGEVPGLIGFVGSEISGRALPYALGAAISIVALATIAPTNGRIRRLDERLVAQGSPYLLSDALQQPPATGAGQPTA